MISNPDLIFYACIAKATTILAQYASEEPNIERLALECLERTPTHHSFFSHTVKRRTYLFLIDGPFVYFSIFDEEMVKSDGVWLLNRIKGAFEESRSMMGSNCLTSFCFQAQFDSIFRGIFELELDFDPPLRSDLKDSRNPSLDLKKGTKAGMVPLLGNPNKGLKKKKRVGMDVKGVSIENKVDVCDNMDRGCREFSPAVSKNMLSEKQKAKQIWKKHVWAVLLLDLFVCAVLFGIWLCICRGFKCIDS